MKKEHYLVPVVAGVVLKKDGKYLLVQEKQPAAFELWNLPAGKVDVGDTIAGTAIKEAKEETGYDVRLLYKLPISQEVPDRAPKHAFAAEIVGGDLNFPKDELIDAKWFTLEEVKSMKGKLRDPWVLQCIELVEAGQ
ncbi:MAG: NUDIX domain-containing protein [bacterium]|nr:NUDIX domain-containing protein [bacterium]